MRKSLFAFLVLVLTIGSGFTLAEVVALRDGPTFAFGSPSALATVRAYYAAVNHYIETGELEGIREVVDPTVLGTTDLADAEGELEVSLRALRHTYPQLRMTIQDVHLDASTVIARVSVDAGVPAAFDRIRIRSLQEWRITETFTVSNGRIASRWSSGPGLGLFSPVPGSPVPQALHEPGRATIARITFHSDSIDHLPIPAPALIVIEQGDLRVLGDGVTIVASANDVIGAVTEPGRDYIVRRNDSIVVSAGRTILEHQAGVVTSLLIAMFLPANPETLLAEHRYPLELLYEALNSSNLANTIEHITVEPIARSASTIQLGAIHLISGWVVLTPGGSVTVQDTAMEGLIVPLAGEPIIEKDGDGLTTLNPGAGQIVLWILQIEDQATPS